MKRVSRKVAWLGLLVIGLGWLTTAPVLAQVINADFIVVPVLQLGYNTIYTLATLLWMLNRGLLLAAFYVMSLSQWVAAQAFAPLMQVVAGQTAGILPMIIILAFLTLAISYLLAVFGMVKLVEFRSAVLWVLFAALIYQMGPELYQGTEYFRRGFGGLFFQEGFNTIQDGGDTIDGLTVIGDDEAQTMPLPIENFYGLVAPFDQWIDGQDVAIAYFRAIVCDVLHTESCPFFYDPQTGERMQLPYRMYEPGNYYDTTLVGYNYWVLLPDQRDLSLRRALDGLFRFAAGLFVSLFALLEQIIHLVLAIAMGIAYVSIFLAILFAFFKRTEPVTWAVFNLIIGLVIQSLVTSLLLAVVMALVVIGATQGSVLLLLGSVFLGLGIGVMLLNGAVKAVLGSVNGMFSAMSAVSGGFMDGRLTTRLAANAAAGVTLARTGSPMQTMGAFAASSQLAQQAYYASRAFGNETALGRMSDQLARGAYAGTMGVVGAALLPTPQQTSQLNTQRALASAIPTRPVDGERLETALADITPTANATQPAPHPQENQAIAQQSPGASSDLTQIYGIGPVLQRALNGQGIQTIHDLAAADPEDLVDDIPLTTPARAQRWVTAAQSQVDQELMFRLNTGIRAALNLGTTSQGQVGAVVAEVTGLPVATTATPYVSAVAALGLSASQSTVLVERVAQTGGFGDEVTQALRGTLDGRSLVGGGQLETAQLTGVIASLEAAAQTMVQGIRMAGAEANGEGLPV